LTDLILVFVIAREAESSLPLKMIAVVATVANECAGISQNKVNILPDELLFVDLRDFLRCDNAVQVVG
jgi:hypothetical protein